MIAEILACAVSVATPDCQIGSAEYRTVQVSDGGTLFECLTDAAKNIASDEKLVELLKDGKHYTKVRCTVGGVGQRA